jgi:RNA polymerase sigma-70 factor (ECF subfamily)
MVPGVLTQYLLEGFNAAHKPLKQPALETVLERLLEAAREAWPDLQLEERSFLSYLGARLSDEGDVVATAQRVQSSDLFLAWACARGAPKALTALEAQFLCELDPVLSRLVQGALLDEVKQTLRYELLVSSPNRRPGIEQYQGRGSLRGWLRVAATRVALRLKFPAGGAQSDDVLLSLPCDFVDPALEALKQRYRHDFAAAFRAALEQLSSREKNLIRFHYLDGLTVDQLGATYQVHRATAARWLSRTRDHLFKLTRKIFLARVGATRSEVDSLIRLIRSDLELSLEIALADKP